MGARPDKSIDWCGQEQSDNTGLSICLARGGRQRLPPDACGAFGLSESPACKKKWRVIFDHLVRTSDGNPNGQKPRVLSDHVGKRPGRLLWRRLGGYFNRESKACGFCACMTARSAKADVPETPSMPPPTLRSMLKRISTPAAKPSG